MMGWTLGLAMALRARMLGCLIICWSGDVAAGLITCIAVTCRKRQKLSK